MNIVLLFLLVFVVETLECICDFCPQLYSVWNW